MQTVPMAFPVKSLHKLGLFAERCFRGLIPHVFPDREVLGVPMLMAIHEHHVDIFSMSIGEGLILSIAGLVLRKVIRQIWWHWDGQLLT